MKRLNDLGELKAALQRRQREAEERDAQAPQHRHLGLAERREHAEIGRAQHAAGVQGY